MVFADNDHTPAILIQCMARMHRIGQTKPTTSYFLIAKDTYDERMLKILEGKDSVVNKTLKEERKLVIECSESEINFRGWEFEPYGISAPQARLFNDVEYHRFKPQLKETQEAFILRITKCVVYDPIFINMIRRRDFSPINQLNLNQVSQWVNVFEYDKALPLVSEDKKMYLIENENQIPIAIFMRKKDLL
jgi:hypothetical protein